MKTLLVTGGAGFIGSAVVMHGLKEGWRVVNIDKLTYSGNLSSLEAVANNPAYEFIQQDIADCAEMAAVIDAYKPDAIMHLAAESHVDRSIDDPGVFIDTNVKGTFSLLEGARQHLRRHPNAHFKFIHISTDEVFGDLAADPESYFSEDTPYAPSSPYSASKAASDHLVRAWKRTFGLPTVVTNCSNNYGPRQFPEKLIPLMIINALGGKRLPVYGEGAQIRDWLYVEDHVRALFLALERGKPGETYNVGGNNEKRNIDVVQEICSILEDLMPDKPSGVGAYSQLVEHVQDRPGHDGRYAIDASKIKRELGWQPQENFSSGLKKTVVWYLENRQWWGEILDRKYNLERLGNL